MRKSIFTDRAVAKLFLLFILAYLGWNGYLAFQQGVYVPLTMELLWMLLPVILFDGIKTAIESLFPKKSLVGVEDLSKVTVVIPSYNGAKVIEPTLNDLLKKFPPESIIIASNGSTDETCAIGRRLGVVVQEYPDPIGKVEAINRAVQTVTTPYTLILDDDTLVGDAVIPTSALDQGYQGVAFTVLPVKQGFWSILQRHEYRKSMSVGKNYHNHSATVQNISGAIGLFQTKELQRQATIHTGEFSGEDLQRTLLIHLSQNGGVVMTDAIVETLAPATLPELYKQRVFGWYPGFLANFDKYAKLIFRKKISMRLRYESFFNVFILALMDPIRLLALPILLFHPVYIVFFYIVYVLLELIPYLAMGAREPLWVVFLYPFYGVFNFLTRVLAMSVFLYRRLTAWVGRAKKLDDYKFMKLHARLTGIALSLSLVIAITLWYASAISQAEEVEQMLLISLSEPVEKPVFDPKVTVYAAETSREEGFRYVVKKGESTWVLASKAVDEYIAATGRVDIPRNQLIYQLVKRMENQLQEGQVFTIAYKALEQAITEL